MSGLVKEIGARLWNVTIRSQKDWGAMEGFLRGECHDQSRWLRNNQVRLKWKNEI